MKTCQVWLANLIYLSFDIYKIESASENLTDFIKATKVVNGGKLVMLQALKSSFKDKEDALQYYTAQQHEADYFISRNFKDYKSFVEFTPVMTPKGFMSSFDN